LSSLSSPDELPEDADEPAAEVPAELAAKLPAKAVEIENANSANIRTDRIMGGLV
jgi:hypothetical protein